MKDKAINRLLLAAEVVAVITALGSLMGLVIQIWLKCKSQAAAISIIGGADGPTSIFLAGKIGPSIAFLSGGIGKSILLAIAVAAAIGLHKYRRLRN